jgi:hypothetical protein
MPSLLPVRRKFLLSFEGSLPVSPAEAGQVSILLNYFLPKFTDRNLKMANYRFVNISFYGSLMLLNPSIGF